MQCGFIFRLDFFLYKQDVVAVDDLRFENCGKTKLENPPCMELDKFECPEGDFFNINNSQPTCIMRTYVCDFQVIENKKEEEE